MTGLIQNGQPNLRAQDLEHRATIFFYLQKEIKHCDEFSTVIFVTLSRSFLAWLVQLVAVDLSVFLYVTWITKSEWNTREY